jgi:hypothetical protein
VANYDIHTENSVKVASQKGKWFNLCLFVLHLLLQVEVCDLVKLVTYSLPGKKTPIANF